VWQKDTSVKVLAICSILFFLIGIVEVIGGLLLHTSAVFDGLAYAVLAPVLYRYRSRMIAAVLLLLSVSALLVSAYVLVGIAIILPLLLVVISLLCLKSVYSLSARQWPGL
jgi:hypothetical protein